jgi:transcriptional regulator with XRE-family HTH domain
MTPRRVNPIRDARERAELSQYDLARKANVHPSTVSVAERGCRVSDETLARIAAALGVPAEALR